MTTMLKGAVPGGLAVFVWSFISWMVLPWHNAQFHKFTDEAATAAVIRANAPQAGLYILPNPDKGGVGMETGMEQKRAGPFIFASVRPGRYDFSFPVLLFLTLLVQIIVAFIITALLLTTRPMGYWARVLFVALVATAGAMLVHLPNWLWWEFPGAATAIGILDIAIGWFIGGLVIAAIARPSAAAKIQSEAQV
jgi:hypothetical protein